MRSVTGMQGKFALLPMICGIALTGCIQVSAPDKPIEINLNINIRQEVMVKLEKDVETLITNNPELFPQ
jgi:hypothetical protein